jgi:hypothetical protein
LSDFVLPAADRADMLARIIRFVHKLDASKRWRVSIEPYVKRRSSSQNAYLWGVCYPTILKAGQLDGWTSEDLHEFFLGSHFGWETFEGFGMKKLKPLRRSSKLTTVEFMDFVAHIQQFMAEKGVYVPDPNEHVDAAA